MKRLRNHALTRFCRGIFDRFFDDRCAQVVSSLTFTTLLALVPLAMLALTVFSILPDFPGMAARFDELLARFILPENLGLVAKNDAAQFVELIAVQARQLTWLGLIGLAVTALLTMYTIEDAFNGIWRVPQRTISARRVVMYWAVLTLGPVLIGTSLTITSYVLSASHGITASTPYLDRLLARLLPGLLTVTAFTLLYYLVPDRRVAVRHALIGGVVAGVLFELGKRGFTLYVSNVSNYGAVYGAFAAIPVFLLWVYVSWMIAIIGALVTAMLPDYGLLRNESAHSQSLMFRDAILVLKALATAHARGQVLDLARIIAQTRVASDRCEKILLQFASFSWVGRMTNERWALVVAPETIRLSDVYRRFGMAPEELARLMDIPEVSSALFRIGGVIDDALGMPVGDLIEK